MTDYWDNNYNKPILSPERIRASQLEDTIKKIDSTVLPPYEFLHDLWKINGAPPIESALDAGMCEMRSPSQIHDMSAAIHLLHGTTGSVAMSIGHICWGLGPLSMTLPSYTLNELRQKDPVWAVWLMLGPKLISGVIRTQVTEPAPVDDLHAVEGFAMPGSSWVVRADSELGVWLTSVRDYDTYMRAITKVIVRALLLTYHTLVDDMATFLGTESIHEERTRNAVLTLTYGRADQLMRTINPAWGRTNPQPTSGTIGGGRRRVRGIEYFDGKSTAIAALHDDDIATISQALDQTMLVSLDKRDPLMPGFASNT